MKPCPVISVLLPAHNASSFIAEAIQSVLKQTEKQFELIVIDDCSCDQTGDIVNAISDDRIKVIRNTENLGVAHSLNKGLQKARGEFIARMDADDICAPRRLEIQLRYLREHPEVGALGSWVRYFGQQIPTVERTPVGPEHVKAHLLFANPIFHPTVMFRKERFLHNNLLYDNAFNRTEDFDLWSRAADHFPLDNIAKPLLRFRWHSENVSHIKASSMKRQSLTIVSRQLKKIGLNCTPAQLDFHYQVAKGERQQTRRGLCEAEKWLQFLSSRNHLQRHFQHEALQQVAGNIFFRVCLNSSQLGFFSWKMYAQSTLSQGLQQPVNELLRFWMGILYHRMFRKSIVS